MSELNVTASSFTGTYNGLNMQHTLTVSKRKCMKFAVGVGIPLLNIATPPTRHAVALAAYKALAVKCAIDFEVKKLGKPAAYDQMDPSEKSNISYWIGMTFAAIIADELLEVSRLIHAAAFGNRLTRTNPKSRRLADLIGQDGNNAWHVVEAKARQRGPSPKTRIDWKAQANTIAYIDGVAPATRSYSLCKVKPTYSAELVDPPSKNPPEPQSIRLERRAVLDTYYGPIIEWMDGDNRTIRREDIGLRVKLAAYDLVDREYLHIGISEQASSSLLRGEIPLRMRPFEDSDTYIGSDGIAIVTSQTPEVQ